jgi:hypothetical protein
MWHLVLLVALVFVDVVSSDICDEDREKRDYNNNNNQAF